MGAFSGFLALLGAGLKFPADLGPASVDGAELTAIEEATSFVKWQRKQSQRVFSAVGVTATFLGDAWLTLSVCFRNVDGKRSAAGTTLIAQILRHGDISSKKQVASSKKSVARSQETGDRSQSCWLLGRIPYIYSMALMALLRNALAFVLIALVRLYQLVLSPIFGGQCRFYPSCSQYMILAIQKHGPIRGTCKGLWRLCKCHPWHPGGFDYP